MLYAEEPETTEPASEEVVEETETGEELEVVDLDIALLEVMVERTELLEKLAEGQITAAEAIEKLIKIAPPVKQRRRKTTKRKQKTKQAKQA